MPPKKKSRQKISQQTSQAKYDAIEFNAKPTKNKKSRRKKSIIPYLALVAVCLILVLTVIITSLIHPIGVIEYISSKYNSIGYSKGYDVVLTGGKPIYTVGDSDKYFVVSASSVTCFNINGKTICEDSHSFSSPVVKASETRYLLYGQGERTLYVNNLSKNLYTVNFSEGITCAALSDSGVFAVASKSEGYSSSVTVFNKNNQKIFEWFSSNESVNGLSVSKNGKTVAVSTLMVVDGKYLSSFYVFNFNAADPIYKKTYTDEVIYQILSTNNNVYCAVLSDSVDFIDYRDATIVSNKSDYSVNIVKNINGTVAVVRTVAANQDESLIEIYKPNGKLKSAFKVDKNITDLSYNNKKVYLLGLHEIYKYNLKGELESKANANFDFLFIEAISENSVACIKNSSIDKLTLTDTEEE